MYLHVLLTHTIALFIKHYNKSYTNTLRLTVVLSEQFYAGLFILLCMALLLAGVTTSMVEGTVPMTEPPRRLRKVSHWQPFCLGLNVLRHWGLGKLPPFGRRHFQMLFLEYKYLHLYKNLTEVFFPKGPFNTNPSLGQIMAWRRPGDRPLSELMMINLLALICVALP